MALVITVGERYRRKGSLGTDNNTRERVFRVWRHEDTTGQIAPLTASEAMDAVLDEEGVTLGSEFPGLAALLCDEITADENDSGEDEWAWDVTCSYSIPSSQETPDDFDEFMNQSSGPGSDSKTNPYGPERSGGGQVMQEYWAKDLDGKKFVLPTGVPMQNVPPIDVTIQVDRITLNEREPGDTSRIGMCSGNSMLANVTYEELTHVNKETGVRTKYYRNSYERWTHPNQSFSRIKILLYGFTAFYDAGGGALELRNILVKDSDPKSDPVSDAQPLDTAGKRKLGGEPDFKEFKIRREGALNIPFMG